MYAITVNIGGGLDLERIQERLRAADEGGVHSVWTGEAWGPDGMTQLALAAAFTKRVQIGSAIINYFSRTPSAIAQHFATLDHISKGRMILGLGSSGANVIEHFHGVPFRKPLTRQREYVEIINMLMSETPLNYEGENFTMRRGFTLRFKPLRPHIPIYLSSLNPASMRYTARHADGWLPIWIPVQLLGQEVKVLRDTAAAAGRDPDALTVRSPGTITITSDPARAREEMRRQIAFYIARMGVFYYRHIGRLLGEEVVAPVKAGFDAGGSAAGAAAVSDEVVDGMFLATDSIERARERMAEQAAAGVQLHQVSVEERSPQEQEKVYASLSA